MDDLPAPPRRLIAASGGFLGPSASARRLRRILELAGHRPRPGLPGAQDAVIAWGHAPRAWRAEALARRTGAALWRAEDAFIRSLLPARAGGEPTIGLLLDRTGIHYDPSHPCDLERLLARHPFDDSTLIDGARLAIERLRHLHLSKYNGHDLAAPPPPPGYVLVIDQVRGDASLTHGGEDGPLPAERLFREMLIRAQEENPGARVLIRSHPETAAGLRPGYYPPAAARDRVQFIAGNPSPWALLDGAVAVYTVSSQLGFEAILAGHKPRVFGQPFYAGWGLTQDDMPPQRRRRILTRAQLFAGAMMLYPLWYDPLRDRLCDLAQVIDQMEARLTAFRQDRQGHVALGMRRWKRRSIRQVFGQFKPVIFAPDLARGQALAQRKGRGLIGWAEALPAGVAGLRVEDGLVRSRGLGAALVPPLSLIADDLGLHYDPARESRVERLIATRLPPGGARRAESLRATIVAAGVTKYNLAARTPAPEAAEIAAWRARNPGQRVILVPGQVEDDASIRLGASAVRTNRALLAATRAACPDALILYKPHPDVVAGLRPGAVPEAAALADLVLDGIDTPGALALADAVWTITSGLGFEALLRAKPVTCLGMPFYAGWGLTDDRAEIPARRRGARPDLDQLTHAALIGAPRYLDPVSGRICPPELAIERLITGQTGPRRTALRLLSRLQGLLASQAHRWR